MASLFVGEWREWFIYQRDLVAAGEWWRLITGHFVHLEQGHLLLNLAAWLLLCAYAQGAVPVSIWVLSALISSGVCGVGLYFFNPELHWVVGFSGPLHGIAVMLGLYRWRKLGDWTGWVLLLSIAGKLLWEQLFGATPGTSDLLEMEVVVAAHLYGAIGTLLLVPWLWPRASDAVAVGARTGSAHG